MAKAAYRAGRDQAATAENVELLTGAARQWLDKAIALRELTALGLATLRPGAGGRSLPARTRTYSHWHLRQTSRPVNAG